MVENVVREYLLRNPVSSCMIVGTSRIFRYVIIVNNGVEEEGFVYKNTHLLPPLLVEDYCP